MLDTEARLINSTRRISHFHDAHLSAGVITSYNTTMVPDLLRSYRQEVPECTFTFSSGTNESLCEHLLQGAIDLAFSLHLAGIDPPQNLQSLRLRQYAYGVLMPASHPLAEKSTLLPKDLEGEELLYPSNYGDSSRLLPLNILRSAGIQPTQTISITSREQAFMTIYVNQPLTLFAECYAHSYTTGAPGDALRFVPFPRDLIEIDISLWTNPENSRPAVQNFRRFCQDRCF